MLEAEEESSGFKKCKHVQDVGLLEIFMIVLSVALFVADIGTDWYQAARYLYTSHTRNSLDNTIEKLYSQNNFNNTQTFFELFCSRISEKYNNKEYIYFIETVPTYLQFDIDTLISLLEQNDSHNRILYDFLEKIYNKNYRKTEFLSVITNFKLEHLIYYTTKIKTADRFYYNFLCSILSQNKQTLYEEISRYMKTVFASISRIPTVTDCETLGNNSKDYTEEYFQESICHRFSFEKVLLERLIYETTYYTLREIERIVNVTEKILSDKKLLDKDIKEIVNKRNVDKRLFSYIYRKFYPYGNNESSFEVMLMKKAIRTDYQKQYWYRTYGVLTLSVLLVAIAANWTHKLW